MNTYQGIFSNQPLLIHLTFFLVQKVLSPDTVTSTSYLFALFSSLGKSITQGCIFISCLQYLLCQTFYLFLKFFLYSGRVPHSDFFLFLAVISIYFITKLFFFPATVFLVLFYFLILGLGLYMDFPNNFKGNKTGINKNKVNVFFKNFLFHKIRTYFL